MKTRAVGPQVIFIGGSGRSGTSITRQYFGTANDVFALSFEYRFIVDPGGIVDFLVSVENLWSPFYYDHKVKELLHFLKWLGGKQLSFESEYSRHKPLGYEGWELCHWFPEWDASISRLEATLSQFRYEANWVGSPDKIASTMRFGNTFPLLEGLKEFCWNVIESGLQKGDKSVFVEDNTWNILYADQLYRLFPNSRFLHVFRDPRDVVASMRVQRWCPSGLPELCTYYSSIMDRWNEISKNIPEKWYREISLEEMVLDPEVAESISEFTGINSECDSNILSDRSFGRWKNDFTTAEKELLGSRLAEYIVKYGQS